MGFLSWMFGTPKAFEETAKTVNKTIDWVGKGIDAAWYTDEEKAKDLKAHNKNIRDMILKLQDEYTPRAITRRIIAVFVVGNMALHLNIAIFFAWLGAYRPKVTDGVNAWDKTLDITLQLITQELKMVMIIVFFYFGYYGVKSVVGEFRKNPE